MGTEEHDGIEDSRYRGPVGTEEEMVHRNSRYGGTVKYRKTVGTEEQMKSRYRRE